MATAKHTAPSAATLYAYARGLEARYPDVRMSIKWLDHEKLGGWDGKPAYKGWWIDFSANPETLRHYGLVTQAELDNADLPYGQHRDAKDEFGHLRYIRPDSDAIRLGVHVPDFIPEGHHTERRVHTKKMQRQVAKLLKRAFAMPRKEA